MREWNLLMTSANKAFKLNNGVLALPQYKKALMIALSDFDNELVIDADRAVANIVICFLNIADVYIVMSQLNDAVNQYSACFSFIKEQLQRTSLNHEASQAFLRAYNFSRFEWYHLSKKIGANTINQELINSIESLMMEKPTTH